MCACSSVYFSMMKNTGNTTDYRSYSLVQLDTGDWYCGVLSTRKTFKTVAAIRRAIDLQIKREKD